MFTNQYKEAIRSVYEEAFNRGNIAILNEIQDPDYVYHGAGGIEIKGPDAWGQYIKMLRGAFSDLNIKVQYIVAEGDMVAHRATMTGTHTGELQGLAPTGKRVQFTVSSWSRFQGEKEIEAWQDTDLQEFYRQLGAAPPKA